MHILRMRRPLDPTLLDLVERHAIPDQEAFLRLLARQGHTPTQSTLSRHLKKLQVQKVGGRYRRVEPGAPPLPPFTLAEAPPNLLVLRTQPGFASALALRLDAAGLPGLVGTLAGDDTVFIALSDPGRLQAAAAQVRAFLEGR